jgi:hypothetical protein
MKSISACPRLVALALCCTLNHPFDICSAQGTAFVYQGSLDDGGAPATGTNYGMVFSLYDAPTNGNLLGCFKPTDLIVSNSLFTVPLDFGCAFDGTARWLEISVQKNDDSPTTLTPRQSILPVPYAIRANTASNLLGSLPVSQLSGIVPAGHLPAALVTNNAANLNLTGAFGGRFSGDGNGLTNIPAGSIVYGNQVAVLNGVLIDASGTYQTFITNNSYLIGGFTNLTAPQSIFSQTISNSSDSTITVGGPPGAFYFGPASANVVSIPAGKEAIWSFWIIDNVRTNVCNLVQQ